MPRPWKEIGRYGSAGIELIFTVLLLTWLGYWLDGKYWGGRGWGVAGGFLLGMAVGFRNLFRTASRMEKDIERAEANDPESRRWTVDESWLHESAKEELRPRKSRKPDDTNETTDDDHTSR